MRRLARWPLDRLLAALAGAVTLLVCLWVWRLVYFEGRPPGPGLYVLEMLLLGLSGSAAVLRFESMASWRRRRWPWVAAGAVRHARGDYDEAYRWLSEALQLCRRTGDPHIALLIVTLFSQPAQELGRLSEADDLLRAGLRYARVTGDRWGTGLGLERLAALAQELGDVAEARRQLEEAAALHREVGEQWSLSRSLIALSRLAEARAAQTDHVGALEMALFVLGHPASSQEARARAEKVRAGSEAQFSAAQLAEIRARAKNKSLEAFV